MKHKINYRLLKYPQTFFNTQKYKISDYKRYKHRLIAWYLLHEYSKDHCIQHLAKYTDFRRVINNEFNFIKQYITKIYNLDINNYTKHNIINCKICKVCAKQCKTNRDTCSNKCANTLKNTKNISDGLKKYYKTADCTERHSKIKDSIITMYDNMTPDEIKEKCVNKELRYTSFDNFEKRFITLKLKCNKDFYYNNNIIPIECECGNKFTALKSTGFIPICRVCTPTVKHKTQNDIYTFIRNISTKQIQTDNKTLIKPLEIDIVSSNFGIEYNGILTHSFGKTDKIKWADNWENKDYNIHLRKTEMCESINIHLFHINEYEWLNPIKQNIWKSIIANKVGINDKIYARKCIIKEISSSEANNFIENNHLQGIRNASIKLGLFYNNELVQVMTLGVPMQLKYKGANHYELIRLCSKINTTVIGGASKLLKYFERNYNPKLIISYANRRWAYSKSTVYNKLGFKYIGKSKPNYVICRLNNTNVYSRQKFQKHKLKNIIPNFNPTISAINNIVNNGYRIFPDSGNLIFTKTY